MPNPPAVQWTPLSLLKEQFRANIGALTRRDPDLAARIEAATPVDPYLIAALSDNRIALARQTGSTLNVIPNPAPPTAAWEACRKLFPNDCLTEPVAVAGIDQGWLWDALYRLEYKTAIPMHRPPLFFLAPDLGRLWVTLHYQNWEQLLADPAVLIFGGPDAARQYQQKLINSPHLPLPRLALMIDPTAWINSDPTLSSADALYQSVMRHWESHLVRLKQQIETLYPPQSAAQIDQRLIAGEKLRILGITSRYTTFLQHSMRDWLSAFESLGHQTQLLIEQADHETMNNMVYLSQIADFRPDLIVIIDHYRGEYAGLPRAVPCAMWVQDRLPNIFSESGGTAQGERDFCLGFGRLHLAQNYGYPKERFLSAPVGTNETRFAQAGPSQQMLDRYRCEASFVSHHTTPAEVLFQNHVEQVQQPDAKKLLADVFERLRSHYEAGGPVLVDAALRRIINESADRFGFAIAPDHHQAIQQFFGQQIVNALYRHTAIKWIADCGADLRLYGRGWESHPTFKRFARGVADNATELGLIYQASAINLQITPFGSVHQRLLDGLAAGGFFLLRHSPGDEVGSHYQALWTACQRLGIQNDQQLTQAAKQDADLAAMVAATLELEGPDFAACEFSLFDVAAAHADTDFMSAASSIWTDYNAVAFRSATDCATKLHHFLRDPAQRTEIMQRMRQTVIDRASYTSITRRLLGLMAQQLAPNHRLKAAA